jgi:HEAT repeat protein
LFYLEPTIQPIIELLNDSDSNVRRIAAQALGYLVDKQAVQPLRDLHKETDDEFIRIVAVLLGEWADRPAEQHPLIRMLKDTNSDNRRHVAEVLGQLGDRRAVTPLIELLKDSDEEVRLRAISALSQIGNVENEEFSTAVAEEFHRLAEKSQSQNASQRERAAEELGQLYLADSVNLLISLLNDEHVDVKKQAIISLTQLGKHQAELVRPALSSWDLLLKEQNILVRREAVRAVGEIVQNFPDEKPAWLLKLADIANNSAELFAIRVAALNALAKLGTDKAAELIMNGLQPELMKHDSLMLSVFQALGNIGSPVALEFLQTQLSQLTERKQAWRNRRDKNRSDQSSPTDDCVASQSLSRDDPSRADKLWQQSQWEFDLGYAIAQIDPKNAGIKLLAHNLAKVRNGAWLAIGHAGDVNIVEELVEKRLKSQQPHFRHAAYQAIHHSLITIEEQRNRQDLPALTALYQDLTSRSLPKERHAGIEDRLNWTIRSLKQQLNRTD